MNINIDFLVITYFVSLFVDWIFQWNWQAENKSKWSASDQWYKSLNALISHSSIYAFLTTLIVALLLGRTFDIIATFMVLFVSHAIIDTRIPVKLIMKFKGMTDAQIYDYQNYGFMHIGIDHRLHEMVLLILSLFV